MRPTVMYSREIQDRPAGYRGPNVEPRGLTWTPQAPAEGAVALVASPPPADNIRMHRSNGMATYRSLNEEKPAGATT